MAEIVEMADAESRSMLMVQHDICHALNVFVARDVHNRQHRIEPDRSIDDDDPLDSPLDQQPRIVSELRQLLTTRAAAAARSPF